MLRKLAMLAFCLLAIHADSFADKKQKANRDTEQFRYDIEFVQPAGDGACLVKVWTYSKKSRIAVAQARKNAVHGVMFKGYASGASSLSQKPLVRDATAEADKADFFRAFFADGGDYGRYVSEVTDGSMEVRKVGREYKVGVVVTVSKDLLRKHLEGAGIIRGLSSGF